MTFNNQILNDSIVEWKHNNIDYNLLLAIILTKQWPIEVKKAKLLENFREQLEMVNIFTSLKIKETSRRILSLESSVISYFQEVNSTKDKKVSMRKLKTMNNHTKACSKDLEKLSKFIILHRVAIRKLNEQIRISIPDEAVELIQAIETLPQYKDGYENVSFIKLDLSSYLLELSLIMDVINDLKQKLNNNDNNVSHTKSKRSDSLNEGYTYSSSISNLTMGEKAIHSNDNSNVIIKSVTKFDKLFLGETESLQKFVLLKDDLENFKFTLLSMGFQILDDQILSTSRDIIENASIYSERPSLMSKRSIRSFHELPNVRSYSSLLMTPDYNAPAVGATSTSVTPQNQFSNAYSQSKIDKKKNKSNIVSFEILNTKTNEENLDILTNESINLFPNIILNDQISPKNPVVMCHIGGFRDHCTTKDIDSETLSQILSKTYQNEIINPIDKVIADWIMNHNLVKVGQPIYCKRTRFVLYQTTGVYLLSLEENITSSYFGDDDSTKFNLPYSVFELRRIGQFKNKKTKLFQKLFDNLVENQINCYPIADNLTIWKMFFKLKSSTDIKNDFFTLLLEGEYTINENDTLNENEFFSLGVDLLKQNCSTAFKDKLDFNQLTRVESPKLTRQASHSAFNNLQNQAPPKVRYWNEFDDEPEYADHGFYIDDDNQSINSEGRDNGFIKFNKAFINSLYDTCQQFRSFIYQADGATRTSNQVSYGDIAGHNIHRDELQQLINYDKREHNENEVVYEQKHDEVVSIMYISSLVASVLISGITLSVVLELFREETHDTVVVHETLLIVIILIFLILSLILICMTLLLLFSRYRYAPVWHYTICFIFFSVVIITVCYGLIELFF